jgi:hypothetical protein
MATLAAHAANNPPWPGREARYADTTGITEMRVGPAHAAQALAGPIVGMGLPMTLIVVQGWVGRWLLPSALTGGSRVRS